MSRRFLHRARLARPCGCHRYCGTVIEAGALYVRHASFPGDDGFEDATRPWVSQQSGPCADTLLDYVRDYYRVPARFGMPFVDGTRTGVIGGAFDQYLAVFFTGQRKGRREPVPFHPVDHIVWEDGQARTTRPGRPRGLVTVELAGVSF